MHEPLAFPAVQDTDEGARFFPTPPRILSGKLCEWGAASSWENSSQCSAWNIANGHVSYLLHQEACHQQCLTCRSPPPGLWAPQCSEHLTFMPPPIASSLGMFLRTRVARESLCRRLVSVCRELARISRVCRKHKLEHSASP